MGKMQIPSNLSKKERQEFLRAHRKPPIPAAKVSDSKAERDRKIRRKEKQKLKIEIKN